jgi:hypothetical protein
MASRPRLSLPGSSIRLETNPQIRGSRTSARTLLIFVSHPAESLFLSLDQV